MTQFVTRHLLTVLVELKIFKFEMPWETVDIALQTVLQ